MLCPSSPSTRNRWLRWGGFLLFETDKGCHYCVQRIQSSCECDTYSNRFGSDCPVLTSLVLCSLRQSIRTGRPTPTSGSSESTVQIDVEEMDVEGVSLRVYDCAGQVNLVWLSSTIEHSIRA